MLRTDAPLPKNEPPKSLSDIFNHEVTRALKEYPHLRGRFAMINAPDNEIYADIDPQQSGFRNEGELNHYLGKLANDGIKMKSSLASRNLDANLDVIVYAPLPFKLFSGPKDAPEVEALAVFDHELGHLVVGGGFHSKDPCYRECAADTFAAVRHMQRYGEDTDFIARGGWRRAYDFVMSGSAMHFTTLALDELNRIKGKVDFKAMTPAETTLLAQRVALEHVPHPDIINSVARSFHPVRQTLKRTGDHEAALRALADITLENENAFYIFRIGSRVLEPFLAGKIQGVKLEGQHWDDVRARMDKHMQRLDAKGILIGIPLKTEKPPVKDQDNALAPPKAMRPKFFG